MKAKILILMSGLAAHGVQADPVTLIASDLDHASSGNDYHSSLVDSWNTAHWSNNEKLSPAYDYVIGAGVFACTPNIANDTATHYFVGRSLTLDGGEGGVVVKHYSNGNSTMDFSSSTVHLTSGVYEFVNDGANLKMNAVVESPASTPFTFCSDYKSWFVNRILTLNLAGASGTAVRLTVDSPETSSKMQWLVTTDSLDYRGALEVVDSPLVVRAADTFKFGGTLRLMEGGSFMANKPLTKSSDAPIGTLDLAGGKLTVTQYNPIMVDALIGKGGTVQFETFHCAAATPKDYGGLIVNDTLALDAEAKVDVVIGAGDALPLNAAQTAGEFLLMKFPAGATVSADNFNLVLNVTADGFTAEQLAFKWGLAIKDSGGVPALYAVRKRIVMSQDSSYSDHNINDGAKWQDGGAAPHAGATYLAFGSSGKLIVTDTDAAFAGDQLVNYANTTRLRTSQFSVPLWTQLSGGGGNFIYTENPSVCLTGGRLEILPAANDTRLTFVDGDGKEGALTIESDLVGNGEVAFNQYGRSTEAKLKTVTLSGDNSGFTGRMSLNGRMDVNVASGTAFGGARPTVEYDAVQFTACANGTSYYVLTPTTDVVFDEPTRGWMLKDTVDFHATEDCSLTIKNPLTILKGQRKDGPGLLALGGELRFGPDSSEEPGTTTDYYLAIRGTIKPLVADAFNGLRLYFYENTGFELDYETEGDLLKYGLRNTKVNSSSKHVSSYENNVITIRFNTGDQREYIRDKRLHGLFTVPTAEVAVCRNIFKVEKPFPHVAVTIREIDNKDGTTTFAALVEEKGLLVIFK